MPLYTRLEYFRFNADELSIIIDNDISKNGQKLYCYLRLNCDINRGISSAIDYKTIASELKMHRTTAMRASPELIEATLIIPRANSTGETYNLPYCITSNTIAGKTGRKRKKRDAEKRFVAEKQNIENTICRRLTHPEIRRLKEVNRAKDHVYLLTS